VSARVITATERRRRIKAGGPLRTAGEPTFMAPCAPPALAPGTTGRLTVRNWRNLGSAAAHRGSTQVGVEVAGRAVGGGWSPHLGVCRGIQYGRTAMRVNRQQQGTRVALVLAVVLVSLWTGSLPAPSAGTPADYLATSRSQPGIQPAIFRDAAPALRPAAERPDPRGRVLLLATLAAAVAGVCRWRAAAQRRGPARAGSGVCSTPREARAPPHLQPA
jgi:hypothetical protein